MTTVTSIAYPDAQTRGQLRHWKRKLAERYAIFNARYSEPNLSVEDDVSALIGDLARCNKLPVGTFACVAQHEGQEVFIQQTPIARRRATEGPHALAGWLKRAGS